ncbi:SlyX family protein [Pelagibius litoralis]|uniref:SlyX family protein n=1 Tax=Pelagibius litoralis TaxID=374515 RepID=A0A967F1J0_9PROT|nr:SlyX family protein [Pelagibius litoralis]NIA71448.1 SlyX family protein [Pelagibius litoralis]
MNSAASSDLTEVQAQIAYNERMLSDLSQVVADQGKAIEKMKAEIEVLGRQVLQITEGEVGSH